MTDTTPNTGMSDENYGISTMHSTKDIAVPPADVPLWKALLAEFIGTFILVFVGASAAALTASQGGSIFGTAAAFGLVLMFLIYVFGSYSGAHFNPAISFGLAVAGRMSWGLMVAYWIVQLIASIAAAALIVYFFGTASGVGATVGSLTYSAPWTAVLLETIITFFLVITVLLVTRNTLYAVVAAIAIGAILAAGNLSFIPLTGASMNPARSLGPAIFSNNISSYWIYVVGPLFGGFIAALFYKVFMRDWSCCPKRDSCGNPLKDECGNGIYECQRPLVDNCGRELRDCNGVQYDTYVKAIRDIDR